MPKATSMGLVGGPVVRRATTFVELPVRGMKVAEKSAGPPISQPVRTVSQSNRPKSDKEEMPLSLPMPIGSIPKRSKMALTETIKKRNTWLEKRWAGKHFTVAPK